MSVNTSAGTPPAAVKDVKENAQTKHGSRKRARRSEPLEEGLSRILAVVGSQDEQQRYKAALSSIDPLQTQTLVKVKVATKQSEHKSRVAAAQTELHRCSGQLERQLTAFKDAVIEGLQEEFANCFSELMDTSSGNTSV
ncbi:hypothetical protein WJX77_003721 [Trebouxia sp. C0004]